jgi:DNA repair protein RecO (recombination protein O)
MPVYRDVGVVLRTHKLGESDRIVNLITQDSGRVRAVAKGVRKTGSRFGSRLEPMSHVQVQLYRGRELDIVNQVELVEVANGVRGHLEATTDGLAMCEVVEQLAHDRVPSPHLYRMLVGALRQLNNGYSPLVLPALLLRLLEVEGVGPCVDRCVVCGTTDHLCAFDVNAGGVQCRDHKRGLAISDPALEVLQSVLGGKIAHTLSRADLPGSVVREVVDIARVAMEHHLERRIRSSSLFEAPQAG